MVTMANYRDNRLLAAMSSAELERLLPHLELVDAPVGKVLSQPGRASAYVYFPTTLSVSLLVDLENGASSESAAVGNEGMVGVSHLLGGGSTLSRAVVTGPGAGFRLRTEFLLEEFNRDGPLMHQLLRYTQALMAQIAQTAVCNRRHSVTEHLCRWLLEARDRLRSEDIEITQERVATILGVRRESVTAAAVDLQNAGVIRYHRGHITLLDHSGLESQSCECYAVVKREYDRLLPAMAAPLNLYAVPAVFDGRAMPGASRPDGRRGRGSGLAHFSNAGVPLSSSLNQMMPPDQAVKVSARKVPDLHINRESVRAERRVPRTVQIGQPAARQVATVLILEDPVEHQNVLATPMLVFSTAAA